MAEGTDLRVGLGFVRGWGEEIARRVVAQREAGGPFRSLVDFLRRTPAALKRPAVENLIWVGGLDALGLSRRELLWQTGLWLGPDEERTRARGRADDPQLELTAVHGDIGGASGERRAGSGAAGPAFRPLDDRDRLVAEYRMLRFSTELHPLGLVRDRMPEGVLTSDRLSQLESGSTVRLAGIVVARQRPQTAKGYIFVLIEDEFGHINVIVKPDVYERCRAAVRMEPFLLVRGRLQKDGATVNIIAWEVQALRTEGNEGAGGGQEKEVPKSSVSRSGASNLPDPLEYWPDPGRRNERGRAQEERTEEGSGPKRAPDPMDLLTPLREAPPKARSWG